MNKIVFIDAGTVGNDVPMPDFSQLGEYVPYIDYEPEKTAERIRDAQIVLTNKAKVSAEHLQAAPGVKFVCSMGTGYNQIDVEACRKQGIVVSNVPDYSTPSVVQQIFSLLLELTNDTGRLSSSVLDGGWKRSKSFSYWFKPIPELSGRTMGIIGYGNIGKGVAQVAHAFGMKVLVYAPRPKQAPGFDNFEFKNLEDVFAQSDVVSLCCPLTADNKGMVDAKLLASMKKSAFLINTARGPLVVEKDLVEALKNGVIAGAGLDVVDVEPMLEACTYTEAPNCVITPHVAWSGQESRTRLMKIAYDNIQAFLEGKSKNVVS